MHNYLSGNIRKYTSIYMCTQPRFRSASVLVQPDQTLHWVHFGHSFSCRQYACWFESSFIMKTRPYNFDPLKPHFYGVNVRFTGVYIIFLIFAQKRRLLVLVRTASLITIYVLSRNMKNRVFYLEVFNFWS